MSMTSKKIKIIRNKLDQIDNKLLLVIKKRTQLVNEVIRQKKTKKEIVDKKRINTILKRIKAKSIKLKIDPMISINIWKTMIRSFIKYEYKNFKKK
jgi:chorismate mutase